MTDNSKKIKDFLDGKLNDQELESFFQELENDENLLEDVSIETIKHEGRAELRKKLDSIYRKEIGNSKTLYLKFLRYAAVVFIVAVAGYLVYYINKNQNNKEMQLAARDTTKNQVVKTDSNLINIPDKPTEKLENQHNDIQKEYSPEIKSHTNDELFAMYFEPHGPTQYRSIDGNYEKALSLYNQEKYTEARLLLNETLKKASSNEEINRILFYSALCMLADTLGNNLQNKTVKILKSIYNDGGEFSEESLWYLAITYIKTNQIDDAKKILRNIVREKTYNYDKAKMLLEKL